MAKKNAASNQNVDQDYEDEDGRWNDRNDRSRKSHRDTGSARRQAKLTGVPTWLKDEEMMD